MGAQVLISNMDTIEYLANKKLISKGIFIQRAYYTMKENKISTLIYIILVLKLQV